MFTKLYTKAYAFITDRKGVTAIEYAILAVAIAVIVFAVFGSDGPLQDALEGAISKVASTIDSAG